MKKIALIFTLIISTTNLFGQKTSSEEEPKMKFETAVIDYGTIENKADGQREFTFINTGNAPLDTDFDNSFDINIGSKHYNRFNDCEIGETMISKENIYFSDFCPPIEFTYNNNIVVHLQMNEQEGNIINDTPKNIKANV